MKRLLQPDDLLYRKIQPGQWDVDGVHPAAFQDRHADLSLFVARVCSPADLLAMFGRIPAVRRACGTGKRIPTPAEMHSAGYRIAVIPLAVIVGHGFQVEVDREENQYREDGHVNVRDGKRLAITWSRNARLLGEEETLGTV